MNHLSEDDLLRHALEAYESDDERQRTTAHLETCDDCRVRLAAVEDDVGVIAGVRPQRRVLQLPAPRHPGLNVYSLLRAAALVILGVALGYGLSNRTPTETIQITSAYVTLSPPADSLRRYAASDATEVPVHYYESLMTATR
jgi:hypothetical protein